ncbi:cyclin-dependent protein kinase [Cryomyces antarcticus]|nr:cyclin-dependent protein kinase [Cryomyces antarcticus]
MVFEYAEHDLLQIIHHHAQIQPQGSRIPAPMVRSIMHQLLTGLVYLHENWVIHRDLKPANIMVTSQGSVKIGDLGLARLFYKPLHSLFSGDKVVVTIWYRAPELLLGSRHYTPAIDLWAVGCIFAELLALKPIFKGEEAKPEGKKTVGTLAPFQKNQMGQIMFVLGEARREDWPLLPSMPEYSQYVALRNSSTRFQTGMGLKAWYDDKMKLYQSDPHGMPSAEGFDLLARLLEYDPNKRLDAKQALKHPYFTKAPKPSAAEVTDISAKLSTTADGGGVLENCFQGLKEKYPSRKVSQDDNDIRTGSLPGTKRGGLPDDSVMGEPTDSDSILDPEPGVQNHTTAQTHDFEMEANTPTTIHMADQIRFQIFPSGFSHQKTVTVAPKPCSDTRSECSSQSSTPSPICLKTCDPDPVPSMIRQDSTEAYNADSEDSDSSESSATLPAAPHDSDWDSPENLAASGETRVGRPRHRANSPIHVDIKTRRTYSEPWFGTPSPIDCHNAYSAPADIVPVAPTPRKADSEPVVALPVFGGPMSTPYHIQVDPFHKTHDCDECRHNETEWLCFACRPQEYAPINETAVRAFDRERLRVPQLLVDLCGGAVGTVEKGRLASILATVWTEAAPDLVGHWGRANGVEVFRGQRTLWARPEDSSPAIRGFDGKSEEDCALRDRDAFTEFVRRDWRRERRDGTAEAEGGPQADIEFVTSNFSLPTSSFYKQWQPSDDVVDASETEWSSGEDTVG